MTRNSVLGGLVMAAISLTAHGDDQHQHVPPASKNAGLEKMKNLVGTWVVADKDGQPTEEVASVIKLTAGGSAVHETIFPGQPHEMVSVYTADGPDLVMTHYCMLGNQPRMKLNAKKSTAQELVFDFDGGTNLNTRRDTHMHSMVLTLPAPGGPQKIHVAGVGYDKGKAQPSCSNTLTRRN